MRCMWMGVLAASSVSIAAPAIAAPSRPGWEKPKDGARLASRDITADRSMPLPAQGAAFYVFTRSALERRQIADARELGLRYLGAAAQMTYTFLREDVRASQVAFLRAQPNVIGTSIAQASDRLEHELLPHLRSGARELPHPLWISFWRKTTKAEVLALLPEAAERMRLPSSAAGLLEEDAMLRLERRAPAKELRRIAQSPFVAAIGFIHPKKLHNEASRALSNADAIIAAPYNLDGTGVLVGHWDGGSVSSSHRDFQGRVTNNENGGVSDHATHTAGTILGAGLQDPTARGFAPAATMIAYDFNGDAAAERREAKHTYYHEHDNHSWGSTSTEYGAYDEGAREFDFDSRDLFLVALKAAGNEGQSSQVVDHNYGFDSLPPDSTSKNVMIICATDDTGDLAGFSSRGPTNDGRVKPDICANGVNLNSTLPGGTYGEMSGTSMATPSMTGMVTLLSQLYKRELGHRWAPDLLQAVMVHTATDVFHTGPDYRFGWGNANAKAAADLILADVAAPGQRLVRGAVREGEAVEYTMDIPAGTPELKATLVWLDAFMNGTAQRLLLNNVDLELISPAGATKYPWTLDPANPFTDAVRDKANERDNVEQVLVENPDAGAWIIRVRGAGITDPDLDVQGFVLATSHSLSRAIERVAAAVPMGGIAVPDGDPAGTSIALAVADRRLVKSLRVHLEVQHERRGDLRVELVHPDSTVVAIETEDTSTRFDLFAIYPDTRSYAEDVMPFYGKPAEGTWTVRVIDTAPMNTGSVIDLDLELELEGPVPPPPNMSPIANAGKDQTADAAATVTLDGSLSSDPDGDMLLYSWRQVSGPAVTLMGADTTAPSFVAPDGPDEKTLVFTLVVSDGRGGSASDDVDVIVKPNDPGRGPNQPPLAKTNGNQRVRPGDEVRLDAAMSSDPDGDPLTFRWSRVSGPDVQLSGATGVLATFTAPPAPDAAIELVFRVEVEDGRGGIDLEDVAISVDRDAPEVPEMPPPGADDVVSGTIGSACACTAARTTPEPGSNIGLALVVLLVALSRVRRPK